MSMKCCVISSDVINCGVVTGGSEGTGVACRTVVTCAGTDVGTGEGVGVVRGIVWFWDVVMHPPTSTKITENKTIRV